MRSTTIKLVLFFSISVFNAFGQEEDVFFSHFALAKSKVQLMTWQDLLKPSEDDLDSLFISSYVPELKDKIEAIYETEIFKVSYFQTQRGYTVMEVKSENLRNGKCDKCPGSVLELGKYVKPGQVFYSFTLFESRWKKSYFLFAQVGGNWRFIPVAYKEPIK